MKSFTQRVEEYARLRKTATDKMPILPKGAKPIEIEQHEQMLVTAIRGARASAKPGDVFTPECRPVFASILKSQLSGAGTENNRAVAKQGNPGVEVEPGTTKPVVAVNAVYPKSASLSSVPATLLMQLPALPMSIEYRFVGNTLVLLDSESNLIIDYLKEAAPRL
jgi:hypothetical protein